MNNIATISQGQIAPEFTGRQLDLIRKTIAADCDASEFDLFIEVARHVRLDPFRRQVMPLVFSKDNPEKRRMSIITGIDGFRVIAARCEDYRPDENEADITYDPTLKGPVNPLGIVKATVTVWKMDRDGKWNPIRGVAYWDEFAPVKDEWAYDAQEGKRKPTGNKVLDASGNWARMPRTMISKCAEAQALRRGWPEDFSAIYDAAEMDRAKTLDLSASEMVEQEQTERRLKAIGGDNVLMLDWIDDKPLEAVPVGKFADRVIAFIDSNADEPSTVLMFEGRNRETLRQFWARSPGDALEIKKRLERARTAPIPANILAAG